MHDIGLCWYPTCRYFQLILADCRCRYMHIFFPLNCSCSGINILLWLLAGAVGHKIQCFSKRTHSKGKIGNIRLHVKHGPTLTFYIRRTGAPNFIIAHVQLIILWAVLNFINISDSSLLRFAAGWRWNAAGRGGGCSDGHTSVTDCNSEHRRSDSRRTVPSHALAAFIVINTMHNIGHFFKFRHPTGDRVDGWWNGYLRRWCRVWSRAVQGRGQV